MNVEPGAKVTNPLGYYFGERRTVHGREQTNLGPCRVCGENVWVPTDAARSDEPPVHKRLCAEREAALGGACA